MADYYNTLCPLNSWQTISANEERGLDNYV